MSQKNSQKNRMPIVASMALAALLLAACGSEQKPAEPPPVKDTAFGDMVGTMDKARGAEATIMQQKEDIDRALEENENPTAE
jgi:hypothetical protein